MHMILEAGEVCRFGDTCPQRDLCQGLIKSRPNSFVCEYVQNGILVENPGFRNPLDQTGKMKIIME